LPLDPEFKKQTEKLISDTLELYQKSGTSPKVSEVWQCENIGDFLCGFFVGEMIGSALSAFQIFHKREPAPEEHNEIFEIVESQKNDIREFFAKFN